MILNKKIPFGYIAKQVIWDVLLVISFSIIIYFLDRYLIRVDVPIQIPTFLGTAIALVLAFKLNQSYDRWWEARKVWGSIVNDSRSVTLQLLHFCGSDRTSATFEMVKKIVKRQIGWNYVLGKSLRKLDPLDGVQQYFSENDLTTLSQHRNVPLAVIDLNLADVKKMRVADQINDFQHIQLDQSFVRLCTSMGQAERIKNTVFPKTYRLYLHFFIYVFLFTLAMSISNLAIYLEIPLMILIALPFFLLEATSSFMQDPFENRPTDTAMTAIARTIEINLLQLLDEEDIPPPASTDKFYQM